MTSFGYTLMTEQIGPRELVRDAAAARAGRLRLRGHERPLHRFPLGLGAGENLNEHVVGRGWPPANIRHEMLSKALNVITALLDGGYVTCSDEHFRTDSAEVWDLTDQRVPIGVAVSGRQSIARFGPRADAMIAVEPDAELVRQGDSAGPGGQRKIGQLPICWVGDRDAAIERAHDQFRWFGGGWKVNAELPGTAGSTDIALVQIGGEHQEEFLEVAAKELLPALRDAS